METHRRPGRRPKHRLLNGDTRAGILKAAKRVFAQRGLDGASIRDVAEAANVNTAMIYYYFRDKRDLYRAVLEDSFSAMTEIWNDEIFRSSAPVREKIRRYIDGYIRFHQANDDLRRIMAMEFASSGVNIKWISERFFADNFRKLVRILRDGMKKGELKKFDPVMAVSSLIGIIVHNFIMQPVTEHIRGRRVELSSKKLGAFVTTLFLDGLARDGGPR